MNFTDCPLSHAENIRALMIKKAELPDNNDFDLSPYFPIVEQLARESASRGENGMVIKFEVADYPDEPACGRAINTMKNILEPLGYTCCVSYNTYALKLHADHVSSSIMRNPAIIALTVIWK